MNAVIKSNNDASIVRQDVYTRVTNKIIADLERGERTWLKPWSSEHAACRISPPLRHNGLPYRGINILLLWGVSVECGYASSKGMTYKQAQELGAHVRKGEHGSLVVYSDKITKVEENGKGEEVEHSIPFMKGYTVFNAEQIEGLPQEYYDKPEFRGETMQLIEAAEKLFAATGATFRHGGNRAYLIAVGLRPGAFAPPGPTNRGFRATYTTATLTPGGSTPTFRRWITVGSWPRPNTGREYFRIASRYAIHYCKYDVTHPDARRHLTAERGNGRMPAHKKLPQHPGHYIKEVVLPDGLTVKDAAEMLGVGRPALSNVLNGNADLSPEMALRIEKAFGIKSEDLLTRQAEYDEFRARSDEKNIAVRAYARSAVDIHAAQIEAWSEQERARSLLAAFLRKLVQSTGVNLSKCDFPAHDNAQRPGWDGQIETDTATPWIPAGKSGWEFGCNEAASKKAEQDYNARTESTPLEDRRETTFVFVTPRNWSLKDKWAKEKAASGEWKNVIALDASNLEQWLEQSLASQAWMADQLGINSEDLLSLDACWNRWASATDPELSKELFRDSVQSHKKTLQDWLKEPPSRPLLITAASEEEALAYLACLFENLDGSSTKYYDRVVAIRSVEAFAAAGRSLPNFIAVIASPEVEKSLAGFQKKQHTIIVRNQAVVGKIDIPLDLLSHQTLKSALEGMGFDDHMADRYIRESGHSLTILRRRLSQIPAVQSPPWAQNQAIARQLIPMVFAGAWSSNTKADQEILSTLATKPYAEVERSVALICQSEQSPVWSLDKYRGVVSKIDALYAIHQSVTWDDLDTFFQTAPYVLCEDDPALDLPEDQRWAANLYGKSRNHSGAIREGICETLVLLAVHGNNLFRERLGVNIEIEVINVIRDLLKPFDPKTWLSQQRDLPRYAEAAPDEFLSILQEDLGSNDPKVFALLKSAESGMFGGCPRSGLLWALELLAWKPERLIPVSVLLAEMSKHKIEDNWSNKPVNSLQAIFRSWMPQTAASIDQRKAALEKLAQRHPDIGWHICTQQFTPGSRVGHYSHRPRWRNDAAGAGQVVPRGENYQLQRKSLEIALSWPSHDEKTLGDLVMCLQAITPDDQETVWRLIEQWSNGGPEEEKKATLRERIRRYAFTRRGRKRELGPETQDRARQIYDHLKPADPVIYYKWLFAEQWVDESPDELAEENFDHKRREERIGKLRVAALKEIWAKKGFEGIQELCTGGNAGSAIGWHLAMDVISGNDAREFLHQLVTTKLGTMPDRRADNCLRGFLAKLNENERHQTLSGLIERFLESEGGASDSATRLCKCAPFGPDTWALVDQLPLSSRTRYWQEIEPGWGRFDDAAINRLVDELLAVRRPRAAFSAVHYEWDAVETPRLVRLLRDLASNESEPHGHYQFSAYDMGEAFKSLDRRTDLSRDELAQLEFMYIKALEDAEYGIPNLERQLAQSPQLFLYALVMAYKRGDKRDDPPELTVPADRREAAFEASYALLENAKRIPGTKEDGTIDAEELLKWISEARELAAAHGRKEVGDHAIGRLLSACPTGADGIWPCEPVRQALEDVAADEIASGMSIGVYNSRGATWRDADGDQERVLAAKYGEWSKRLAFESPYVSKVLQSIARSYDRDAERWETDDKIRQRIRQ